MHLDEYAKNAQTHLFGDPRSHASESSVGYYLVLTKQDYSWAYLEIVSLDLSHKEMGGRLVIVWLNP